MALSDECKACRGTGVKVAGYSDMLLHYGVLLSNLVETFDEVSRSKTEEGRIRAKDRFADAMHRASQCTLWGATDEPPKGGSVRLKLAEELSTDVDRLTMFAVRLALVLLYDRDDREWFGWAAKFLCGDNDEEMRSRIASGSSYKNADHDSWADNNHRLYPSRFHIAAFAINLADPVNRPSPGYVKLLAKMLVKLGDETAGRQIVDKIIDIVYGYVPLANSRHDGVFA